MGNPSARDVYVFGDFRLDAGHRMLYKQNEELPLAPKAVEILVALVERPGEIVSKDELLESVWPDAVVDESNLFLYLSVLRKTLGEQENAQPWLETRRRRGYRFIGEVRRVENEQPDLATNLKFDRPTPPNDSNDIDIAPTPKRDSPPRRASLSMLLIAATGLIGILAVLGFVYRFNGDAGSSPARSEISVIDLTSDDVHGPIISRDGKHFAYGILDGETTRLMLQQVGQPNSLELLPGTTLEASVKNFSPDGTNIYLVAREKGGPVFSVYRVSIFGGAPKKVLANISYDSSISFSPDGNEFVFSRNKQHGGQNSITIAKTDGTHERDILVSESDVLAYPEWSRDGKQIVFSRTIATFEAPHVFLEAISPEGGDVSRIIEEPLDNCYRLAWTKDGRGLVFGGTKLGEAMTARRDQVWYLSLASRKLTRISPEGSRYFFGGLSDDGAAIVGKIDRTSQVWMMDENGDSRTATQLTRGTTDGRSGIAPLPDGRVGYLTRNGDNWEIWVMNADGSNPTQTYNGRPIIDELRATPDGKYFLFNSPIDRTYNLFRLNTDGTGLTQLTAEKESWVGDPAPSSDSRWVIYYFAEVQKSGARTSSLRRISIDGGKSAVLDVGSSGAQTSHYSPDGRLISYVDVSTVPPKVSLTASDGGPITRSFDTGANAVLNVGAVWTPDGEGLAYIAYENKASNIWIQPIDGGPRRRLTDFTSGHIYRIAYSADGKTIYLARGYAVNDALLIKGFLE